MVEKWRSVKFSKFSGTWGGGLKGQKEGLGCGGLP